MSAPERQDGHGRMSAELIGECSRWRCSLATVLAVLAGYPVAFTLAGVGLGFAALGIAFGVFDVAILSALVGRYFGTMTNETLVAVPLFVFMGVMLERSKIAEALLTTMGELFGSLRGGLGYSVVIVGALLAASTGIVGATVVTMGLLSLPAMMRGLRPEARRRHDCAAGTLGPDHPAVDGADLRRRHPAGRQPAGAARARQPVARADLGRAAVRGRDAARPHAGGALPRVDPRQVDVRPDVLSAARNDRASSAQGSAGACCARSRRRCC